MKPTFEDFQNKYENIFEQELLDEIYAVGVWKEFPADSVIMEVGQTITHIPLILSGTIKILTEDEDGNELLLYYLEYGETCAMTLNCCTKKSVSSILAITEELSRMFMIPVEKMEEWMVKFSSWRNFVLESYNARLNEMLQAIDNLAFNNMEERVLNYLQNKAHPAFGHKINITHYKIANDLNSSRVVISRILKKLSIDGKINMNRNEIELLTS